jgi:voltage-gated potassium channel
MTYFVTLVISQVKRSQALRLVLVGAACLLVGAVLFSATQGIAFTTALYWAITTATTVGYGDITPKDPAGRAIAVGVMLTTIPLFASAFALMAGAVVTTHLRRLLGVAHLEPVGEGVVIYGSSPVVPRVARELAEAGRRVVVVANMDRSNLPDAVTLFAADPTSEETVRRSHPEKASQLLVSAENDADVLVTAVLLRHVAPAVPTVAVVGSPAVGAALRDLGVDATLSSDELLVHTLAKSMEAPHAGELLLRLVDSEGYQLKELPIGPGDLGRALASVRRDHPGLVLGAVHDGHVTVGVAQDVVLAEGDQLIVLEAARS